MSRSASAGSRLMCSGLSQADLTPIVGAFLSRWSSSWDGAGGVALATVVASPTAALRTIETDNDPNMTSEAMHRTVAMVNDCHCSLRASRV
jgi:hypothetical protein